MALVHSFIRHGVQVDIEHHDGAHGDGTHEVFVSNTPGVFENLHHVRNRPRRIVTLEEAIEAGARFVDDRQWKLVSRVGVCDVYVRLWWNGDFGYSVRVGGSLENRSGFGSFDAAKSAGIEAAIESYLPHSEAPDPVDVA